MSAVAPSTESPPATALRGPWRHLGRAAWGAVALLVLWLAAISLPSFLSQGGVYFGHEPAALARLLMSDTGLVLFSAGANYFVILAFVLTAAFVFWRKSDDWMAMVASLTLLTAWVFFTPFLPVLRLTRPEWQAPVDFVFSLAGTAIFLFFWLFPDGRFVPRWMRWLLVGWGVWILAYLFFPTTALDPDTWPVSLRVAASFLLWSGPGIFVEVSQTARVIGLGLVVGAGLIFSLGAQIHRFFHVSGPAQRQQTKWVILALAVSTLALVIHYGVIVNLPWFRGDLRRLLAANAVEVLTALLVPAAFAVSMMHYRLWDIDVLVRRTLVYGLLTGALAVFFYVDVVLIQYLFRFLTGPQSDLVLILTTLGIAALVAPLQRRIQAFIDRRFYRETVDFRKAFTDFALRVRTIIDLEELLHVMATLMSDILHIRHGAIYLVNAAGEFELAHAHNMPPEAAPALSVSEALLPRLRTGQAVDQAAASKTFPLLVPLVAPKAGDSALVGVLALGPRLSEQGYSREDQALLSGLADQAGTAIYVARLIQEREGEIRRREAAERRLEAHRNSPVGRAEILAHSLLAVPETALVQLHALAQRAGHDADSAALLDPLPRVLEDAGAALLAGYGDGYHYIFNSQSAPELLPVGLRQLTSHLALPEARHTLGAAEALAVYALCQRMLEANSVAQITAVLPALRAQAAERAAPEMLADLVRALSEFGLAAEALHASERVDAAQDKLAYLAGAVERLSHLDRHAGAELGSADGPVAHRIAASWLAVVTHAMTELQTRAQIACRLLTRHTWQEDVIALTLELRNTGRGAAVNVRVSLAPAPEYALLEAEAALDRLAPGEERQVEMRVQPRLAPGTDQFRVRFTVAYADPRGPDQLESYADVVSLMPRAGEFRFIPNPYVVGTPLQPGSPLFVGREDVVKFVQENLAAQHRNNLVLIGQRRTGKTSLLKQLSLRLGDDYLPVYVDGQTLGLDPGLPNFFLTLATEIAFALQDRGFDLEPPELGLFADSPAAAFERQFLGRVRALIGRRHLLILFDEFEELETAVRRGHLEPSIFGFLRHLIQHFGNLSVIFCGTHRLEELATDYWSVLFNISLYRHVAYLEQEEAARLIQAPVEAYGMRYDDLALDKMWRVTAGHPYFLQLLCHSLVNRHNKTERGYVTIADVNAALEDILASGEAHFVYLWNEAAAAERLAMVALSRMLPAAGQATPAQVMDFLAERGVSVDRREVTEALHRLRLRDVLRTTSQEQDVAAGEAYGWKLGLLGLWVEKFRSLSRVIDEMS